MKKFKNILVIVVISLIIIAFIAPLFLGYGF